MSIEWEMKATLDDDKRGGTGTSATWKCGWRGKKKTFGTYCHNGTTAREQIQLKLVATTKRKMVYISMVVSGFYIDMKCPYLYYYIKGKHGFGVFYRFPILSLIYSNDSKLTSSSNKKIMIINK